MDLATHSSGSLVVFGQTLRTEVKGDPYTTYLFASTKWLVGGWSSTELEINILARLCLGRQHSFRLWLLSVLRC